MHKLQVIYRVLLLTITISIGVQSAEWTFDNNDLVIEQEDASSKEILGEAQPLAMTPVISVQINKWLYVTDLFSVALETPQVATHLEQLNLVLSYFEVLFESCINVNAP